MATHSRPVLKVAVEQVLWRPRLCGGWELVVNWCDVPDVVPGLGVNVLWVPWTKVLTDTDGRMKVEGPMGKLLDMISSVLSFDYEFVRPVNMAWGRPYPNGSWDGMLGQLQRREVEFAVGPFGVTYQRESICDFTDPMYSENNAILMVRPTLRNDMAGFLKPFSGKRKAFTTKAHSLIATTTTRLRKRPSLSILSRDSAPLRTRIKLHMFLTGPDTKRRTKLLHR
ncbi:putative glutamate receptor [Portunus trituberculatus]|uniref:Putative glutamate receptor n=1 Tax=Portunus trituberculatus TaxID=210409 RepID=A0A5B7GAF3_PORTR|nr:putative glutamate receptor [Portunus trituberculatus]